jgi:hypothetical protein
MKLRRGLNRYFVGYCTRHAYWKGGIVPNLSTAAFYRERNANARAHFHEEVHDVNALPERYLLYGESE